MQAVSVSLVLACLMVQGMCFNHWVVTEDGKIEYQASSPFNLRQPFDLMAFMKQEERVSILKELQDELLEYKNEFEAFNSVESLEEYFYIMEPECKDVPFITSQDLFVSTVLPLEFKGIRLIDHLEVDSTVYPGEPYCTMIPLPFSMYAMDHLESIQNRRSLVAPPERNILGSLDMSLEVFGSLVHHAMKKNSTSWVLLDLATLYWRARGHPHHAVDCVRRALHYSPTNSMDIALLNLANLLHRSQQSQDALVPLQVAVSLSPDISVLHYTKGNIHAALGEFNQSASSFQHCVHLDPSDYHSLSLYHGALCDLRRLQSSEDRTRKLDNTQRKLDEFYDNMELIQKLQHPSINTPTLKRPSKVKTEDVSPGTLESKIEEPLPEAVPTKPNLTVFTGEKVRSDSLRLVLRPLLLEDEVPLNYSMTEVKPRTSLTSLCLNRFHALVLSHLCPKLCFHELFNKCQINASNHCRDNCAESARKAPQVSIKLRTISEDESSALDTEKERPVDNTKTNHKFRAIEEYPLSYHSLEFQPYNPLPDKLEYAIFPYRSTPLADYDDPNWPDKPTCLELVAEVREDPQLANFPGTFLPPAARGADIKGMFATVPEVLPAVMRKLPTCTDIVELSFSISGMDHLATIAKRHTLKDSKTETALKKVLIDAVSGDRVERFSFEESAYRTYAAMYQIGPNWAMFNIASLYWRVLGDARNAIECLRRGLHYAPAKSRDVGLVGMANVLHGLGALDEAVIVSRAALDIKTESPVGHYTLASVYSTQGDYIASSLHLRAALHVSIFNEAILSLKLLRCSLKFKEEQTYLRNQVIEKERQFIREQNEKLLAGVAQDILDRKPIEPRTQAPYVFDNIDLPEIPEMKVQEMQASEFTGDNAIQYLLSSAMLRQARIGKLETRERLLLEEHLRNPQDIMRITSNEQGSIERTPRAARQTQENKPKPKKRMDGEVREEDLNRRVPGNHPWPSMEDCVEKPPPKKLVFTSTWLSVTAKGAKIKEFIDFNTPLEHYPLLPYCHNDFEDTRATLSHLNGMSAHPLVQYKPEKGLQEVLCNMDGTRRSLEEMATRIKTSLAKHPNSWVVSNLAALYWRIVGQGQLAIKCLRHALYFSDDNGRDVALVSLANVLYKSGFDMDALAVIHMSLEASPTLVVTHFTLANILAAQGFYVDASSFYESTLQYQPQFQPAAERLNSVRCLILLARKRLEDEKRKELQAETPPSNTT